MESFELTTTFEDVELSALKFASAIASVRDISLTFESELSPWFVIEGKGWLCPISSKTTGCNLDLEYGVVFQSAPTIYWRFWKLDTFDIGFNKDPFMPNLLIME